MKSPLLFLCVLSVFVMGLGGCAPRPLTETAFRGFCYTNVGKWTSCDTFTICDDFDNNVLSVKHASRADCLQGCREASKRQSGPNWFNGCSATVLDASNWCATYCNTNYAR